MAPRKGKSKKPPSRQCAEKNNAGRRCGNRFLVKDDNLETRCHHHRRVGEGVAVGKVLGLASPFPKPKLKKTTPAKLPTSKDTILEPEPEIELELVSKRLEKSKGRRKAELEPESTTKKRPKPDSSPVVTPKEQGRKKSSIKPQPEIVVIEATSVTRKSRRSKLSTKLQPEIIEIKSTPKTLKQQKSTRSHSEGVKITTLVQKPRRSMSTTNSQSEEWWKIPATPKPRRSRSRKKQVSYWEGILTAEEALDPDYELDQYDDRLIISKSGFRDRRPLREVTDLPQAKQSKVRKLQQARERGTRIAQGKETHSDEVRRQEARIAAEEEEIRLAKEKVEIKERLWKRERDATTVEGRYFLYRYRRNIWRQSLLFEDPAADISDEAFRRSQGLPVYEDEHEWHAKLYFRRLGMTPLCETREMPNYVWTREEKRVMRDMEEAEGDIIDKQEDAIGNYFNGRPPGEWDYSRAKRKMSEGQVLTDDERFLLNNAALFQVQLRAEAEQNALDEAHKAVLEGEIDRQLIERDERDARELQGLAIKEAEKARAT